MKKSFLFPLVVLLLLAACTPKKTETKVAYGEATQQLVALVEQNPDLKAQLQKSIEMAKQINPDTTTNPAQTLEDYYGTFSMMETAMPWTLLKKDKVNVFDDIMQGFCSTYFIIDQPLPELEGKGYFRNSLQYAQPFAGWMTQFNKSWGKYLDTESSWNDSYYQLVLNDPMFGLQNGWYEDPSHWKTFNQFFARHLSSPAARPIASPDDDAVVAAFADSEPQGVWAVDASSNLLESAAVKSATVNSVSELLGTDNPYKDAFANGTFMHSFLNVNDYHRYHFSMSGTVKDARIINGINPSGGTLEWIADEKRYRFTPASVGWQMLETRGVVILETPKYGLVALVPIGMAVVGSVNFEESVKPGAVVKKGDPLGWFAFGGSDFILVFQDKVKFELQAPKNDSGSGYKHMLMGERLGAVKRK